jgi:hypothetical protein
MEEKRTEKRTSDEKCEGPVARTLGLDGVCLSSLLSPAEPESCACWPFDGPSKIQSNPSKCIIRFRQVDWMSLHLLKSSGVWPLDLAQTSHLGGSVSVMVPVAPQVTLGAAKG